MDKKANIQKCKRIAELHNKKTCIYRRVRCLYKDAQFSGFYDRVKNFMIYFKNKVFKDHRRLAL